MYRIYYPNGKVFDGDEGDKPFPLDCQIIVQEDRDKGWVTTHAGDFYIWQDDRWWNCDLYGLFRFLMDTGLVLFGQTIPHREFDEIYQQAKAYKQEMINAESSI